MSATVFNQNKVDFTKQPMFFGEALNAQRFDVFKYPVFDKLTQTQLGYFWRPEEVSLQKDRSDYLDFRDEQKFIFTANLKYQILLDSVQGRAPAMAFMPYCTLPELEGCMNAWQFFENIHSRSYTHIIKNVYSDPSEVFDTMLDDEKIIACSFAFGELKKMEGSAKIISLIARDESQHLSITSHIIKNWQRGDDPEMQEIAQENYSAIGEIYDQVVAEEKDWADHLFSRGAIVGLNERLLHQYVEYIGNRRLKGLGVEQRYDRSANDNPLPWTEHWTSSKGLQVAPQETEIESYVIGGIKQDVSKSTFAGFKL